MIKTLDTIGTLFEQKQTVAAIHIEDYLDWASKPDAYPKTLAIPPIQRGFVWKPKQIQDLWDSLLRGMPIGSILLKEFSAGAESGSMTPIGRQQTNSIKSGFHLMDGQQRTLSMLLGFPNSLETEHKLWIDLRESGNDGSLFRLRVSTVNQPFGYQPDGKRLSVRDRDNAKKLWDERTDKGADEMANSEIFKLAKPWKGNGANQSGLFEIKYLWQELITQGLDVWMKSIRAKLIEIDGTDNQKIEERILTFGNALIKLRGQWLALIKIPHIDVGEKIEEPGHDYLTMLFDRISSGGTRLSPDDLLFSMIKQNWPDAHNLVYQIQKEVGSMMKPTDFVMTAYRLAALQGKAIEDDPKPDAKSFHKNLNILLGSNDKPGHLRRIIADGSLQNAFKVLKELLEFRCDAGDKYQLSVEYETTLDYGLPMAIFPYLDRSLLQVLLFWVQMNGIQNPIPATQRLEIIRFIMYWLVCNTGANSRYDASKKAISIISTMTNKNIFPGYEIYKVLSEESSDGLPSLFCCITVPPELAMTTSRFRDPHERAKYYFGTNTRLYDNFSSKKTLLIWFQRHWIKSHCTKGGDFEGFSPLAGQDDDVVPYDFDHLVPQSNWSSFSTAGKPKNLGSDVQNFLVLWSRRSIGNSIGNYRVMSARENRARGDESLNIDLLDTEEKKKEWAKFVMLCNNEELTQWREASPKNEPYDWNTSRVLAFQMAVELRTLRLYKYYYSKLSFGTWILNPSNI